MNVTHAAFRLLLLSVLGVASMPWSARAQTPQPNLNQMSLEDLMRVQITSASRKEQKAADVAAAVFVITQEDIRRSGMTTVPDLLRLVPGVQVAQINSNKWAVTVRGFNALYANKLLVLVDGRSVYYRIFSGVLWDTEDLMLDDIDRIEVIRGPGAALWGANAVNAVINIVTKPASGTKGALVRVDGGRAGEQAAVRYGGTLGSASYRLFSQWTGREASLLVPGTRANDASHSITTGFRADWTTTAGVFMADGDFTAGQTRAMWPNFDPQTAAREPIAHVPSDTRGGHLLGRWTHTRAGGASLQVQSFVGLSTRVEPVGDYRRRAVDVDSQYHTALGSRHDLVAGAGYRFITEELLGGIGFSLTQPDNHSSLLTAFVQDEIDLFRDRMSVTLGSQVQYDSDAGAGVQPSVRVMWKALRQQRLWVATSRALRTPSLTERWIRVEYPPVPTDAGLPLIVTSQGNPDAKTETLVDLETGYRLEIGTAASIDVTGFIGRYTDLATRETAAPTVLFAPSPHILVATRNGNALAATTRGLEIAGHWEPTRTWRLDGSYTAFDVTPRLALTSQDIDAATTDASAPRSQWQLRSAFSPGAHGTLGVSIFRVGPLEELQVAGYTRADITAEWRFSNRVSAMVVGQNLFDAAHAEFAGVENLVLATQVPRSVGVRLRWTLR